VKAVLPALAQRVADWRPSALAVLATVTAAFVIMPIGVSAFLADDQFNSTVNGFLSAHGITASQLAWHNAINLFRSTSRFVPGFYYQAYWLFNLVPGLAAYKAVQIVTFALDLALLGALLRALRFDAAFAVVAVLFVLTSVQFHGHYDGYLGFSVTNEFWLLLIFSSWLAFTWWLRSPGGNLGRRISVLLFIILVLQYEAVYPISLGHLFIAMRLRGRSGWRTAIPFLAISAFCFGQMLLTRVLIPQQPTADYSLHVTSFGYLRTVFFQTTASLPLMYLAFHRDALFPPAVGFWSAAPTWLLLAVAVVSGSTAFVAFRSLRPAAARTLLWPACLGLWLWIEAALLLAAIPRYQVEVGPGFGYSEMVMGGFGAGIVIACIFALLAARVSARARPLVAAVLAAGYALVLTASFETNARTLVVYEGERAALINLTAALDHGVLSDVPEGATVLTDSPLQLMQRYAVMRADLDELDNPKFFVREHAGRLVRMRGLAEEPVAVPCRATACPVDDTFGLHDVPIDVRDGFTAVARLSRVSLRDDGTLRTWSTGAVRLHVRGDRLASADLRDTVIEYACAANGAVRSAPISLSPAAIRGGSVMLLRPSCAVDLASMRLVRRSG
jgi:hypothetical protein